MARARDGVKVRVLLDGFGVWLGGHFNLRALRAAGIEVVKFVPALRSAVRGLNLRNHRKMVLVDGERLWTGGRNLAAEYFVGEPARGKPRLARPDVRPCAARSPARPSSASTSTGTTPRTVLRPCAVAASRRQRPRRRRGAVRPAGSERPGPGRRHRAGAAGLGRVHGAAPDPCRHAVLRSRRDAADGADAGGAPRCGRRPGAAGALQPSPRRRRPQPPAARPGRVPARASG